MEAYLKEECVKVRCLCGIQMSMKPCNTSPDGYNEQYLLVRNYGLCYRLKDSRLVDAYHLIHHDARVAKMFVRKSCYSFYCSKLQFK